MAIETATYVDDLSPANPDGSAFIRGGDDHLRLIKNVLQNSLKNLNQTYYVGEYIRKRAVALTKTSTYTLDNTANATDDGKFIKCDATSAAFEINLPAASNAEGYLVFIQKQDASSNIVTIAANGTDTIAGNSTVTLSTQYSGVTLYCYGTGWAIVGSGLTGPIGNIALRNAPLAPMYGGIGRNASTTGGASPAHVVKQKSVGGAMDVEALVVDDIPVLRAGPTTGTNYSLMSVSGGDPVFKGNSGWCLLESTAVGAVTSAVIESAGMVNYRHLRLDVRLVPTLNNTNIWLELHNGAAYGVSYVYGFTWVVVGSSGVGYTSASSGTSKILLAPSVDTTYNTNLSLYFLSDIGELPTLMSMQGTTDFTPFAVADSAGARATDISGRLAKLRLSFSQTTSVTFKLFGFNEVS
jgi:hypothetical protein